MPSRPKPTFFSAIPSRYDSSALLQRQKRFPASKKMEMASDNPNPSAVKQPAVAPAPEVVTAIVPARNEEAVIAACIESLARQPEIAQILVVNDQSSDATAEVVRDCMKKVRNL